MSAEQDELEMKEAHAAIGGFVARCSLLDYRVSQFMARWFCTHEKQKFLSYTLKAMPFAEKRQVIDERLSGWHSDPTMLKATTARISEVFERRNLAVNGVLSRRSSGALCIKSFSGARFITGSDSIDILEIVDLNHWSEQARELAEQLAGLGAGLQDTPTSE